MNIPFHIFVLLTFVYVRGLKTLLKVDIDSNGTHTLLSDPYGNIQRIKKFQKVHLTVRNALKKRVECILEGEEKGTIPKKSKKVERPPSSLHRRFFRTYIIHRLNLTEIPRVY